MNIKRVVEKDTRSAFEKVKELYGEDVVILSNKRIGKKQVEVMVAVDLNDGSYSLQDDPEADVGGIAKKIHSPSEGKAAPTVAWMEARKKAEGQSMFSHREPLTEQESIAQVKKLLEKTKPSVDVDAYTGEEMQPQMAAMQIDELDSIKSEMSQLRDMFKTHLDISDRNEREALSVEAKEIISKLENECVDTKHIEEIQKLHLTKGRKRDFWKKTMGWWAEGLVNSNVDPVLDGGIYAFVGLSGVGKTTTIIKMASQAALKYGKEKVALITLDHKRIGAKEQIKLYGMMLGVKVMNAANTSDLRDQLKELSDKRFVLIDTAGASVQSDSLRINCEALKSSHDDLRLVLAMSANSQSAVNNKICAELSDMVEGTILTKLDEAIVLGSVLSIMRDSQIGLIGVSCGSEIPKDYQSFTPDELIDKCFGINENITLKKPEKKPSKKARAKAA